MAIGGEIYQLEDLFFFETKVFYGDSDEELKADEVEDLIIDKEDTALDFGPQCDFQILVYLVISANCYFFFLRFILLKRDGLSLCLLCMGLLYS